MSSNPRVRRLKARAAGLKARVRRLKARVEAWKPRVKRKDSEFKNIEFHDFTVSNETILATKQEFFFTKLAPVQSITGIVLLGFSLILLPRMFISYYTIIYFFVNNFFSNVYISVNTIFECSYLSFAWEIGYPLSTYVTRGMEVDHPKCLQMRTVGKGYHASCVRTHLLYLFSCFSMFFHVSILHRYLQTLFYTIIIVVVTVT